MFKPWMVTVPTGLLALIGLIADKGEKLVQVLALLTAWTARLPGGVWSFLGMLALSMLLWATLIRKFPPLKCGKRAGADADVVVLAFATLMLPLLQWSTGGDRPAVLMATVSGFGVGLLAPLACRIVERFIPRKADKPLPPPVSP